MTNLRVCIYRTYFAAEKQKHYTDLLLSYETCLKNLENNIKSAESEALNTHDGSTRLELLDRLNKLNIEFNNTLANYNDAKRNSDSFNDVHIDLGDIIRNSDNEAVLTLLTDLIPQLNVKRSDGNIEIQSDLSHILEPRREIQRWLGFKLQNVLASPTNKPHVIVCMSNIDHLMVDIGGINLDGVKLCRIWDDRVKKFVNLDTLNSVCDPKVCKLMMYRAGTINNIPKVFESDRPIESKDIAKIKNYIKKTSSRLVHGELLDNLITKFQNDTTYDLHKELCNIRKSQGSLSKFLTINYASTNSTDNKVTVANIFPENVEDDIPKVVEPDQTSKFKAILACFNYTPSTKHTPNYQHSAKIKTFMTASGIR